MLTSGVLRAGLRAHALDAASYATDSESCSWVGGGPRLPSFFQPRFSTLES